VASKAEQAIVTAAVPADVPEQLQGAQFEIVAGEVRRVR
jgi:DNA replication and repair protein RecF